MLRRVSSGDAQSQAGVADESEILRADPRHRLEVAVVGVLGLALGAFGVVLFRRRLVSLYVVAVDDPATAVDSFMTLASGIFLGFGILVTLGGVHLFLASRRGYRAGRMPPPGTRVVRDTPVVRGDEARRRARVAMILAAFLAILGAATPLVGSLVLGSLAPSEEELRFPAE